MIKLVKFNLLIDAQRCRTIEDLRNNFNLLDVMEEFHNGKLEKWLRVRNFDQQFEQIKSIDKNSDLQKIAQNLCKIFDVTISEADLKNELMTIEYQKLSQEQQEDHEIVKQIFDQYYKEHLQNTFSNKSPKIKKIVFSQNISKTFFELFSEDIRIMVLGNFLANDTGAMGGFYGNGTAYYYQDKHKEVHAENLTTASGLLIELLPRVTLFNGLEMRFEKKNSKYDNAVLYVIDIDDKLNNDTVKNAKIVW